jgi:single-strand DNA-binding protein
MFEVSPMNLIQIAGHLGNDPEVRFTPSGQKVTTFRVGTRVRRGGKDETIWFRVTVWGDRLDKMISFLKKGSPVIVVGELQKPEIYMDREGKPQISLEITAELLRFSPFGKPEGKTDRAETPAGAPHEMSVVGAGAAAGAGISAGQYAGFGRAPQAAPSQHSAAEEQFGDFPQDDNLPF